MNRSFLAALALLIAAPALAADAVIAQASGPVFLLPQGGKAVAAKGGESLLYGDSVRTGAGGVAQVVIGDRGAVLVRENTRFSLQGNPRRTTLAFSAGEFLIGLRRRLERGQSFRVRTPAAIAAVRGTLFWGKSDAERTTTYAGLGHEIAVTAKGKTVVVRAGETTTVALGKAPAAVTRHAIPLSYLDNFKVMGSLQGLESLAAPPAP